VTLSCREDSILTAVLGQSGSAFAARLVAEMVRYQF
jgi:hypothetical protein